MQFISNDKTARINTIQDMKDFNSQYSCTQANVGEQLVAMMPSIR